jgi:hypothetical protein
MVDVWMLFTLVLPFLDVILQTYCYLLSQGEEEKEEEKRETGTGLSRVRVGATTLTLSSKKNLKRYDAKWNKEGKCYDGKLYPQGRILTGRMKCGGGQSWASSLSKPVGSSSSP